MHTMTERKDKYGTIESCGACSLAAPSERVTRQIEQLELRLEELEAGEAEEISKAVSEDRPLPIRERSPPKRKPLPEHLPRQEVVHEPEHDGACTCPACGSAMARLGEDVTEVLDYVPGRFRVVRHVRPKYACRQCDAITQAPAPALPTPRGRAAPGMLAHLLVAEWRALPPVALRLPSPIRSGRRAQKPAALRGRRAGQPRPVTRATLIEPNRG
jgi:transposase